MNFVASLYLNQNRSYGQKGVFDLFADLDLDLGSIMPIFELDREFICAYLCVKYLSDILKIVAPRGWTDKQTDRQTDRQTNKHDDQHTFEKRSFRK